MALSDCFRVKTNARFMEYLAELNSPLLCATRKKHSENKYYFKRFPDIYNSTKTPLSRYYYLT